MDKSIGIILIAIIALASGFFISHITFDRYYFIRLPSDNIIAIYRWDKITGDIELIARKGKNVQVIKMK